MWDETADVIVVGSGFAGLAAAIEAKLMGADVLSVRKKRDWASRNSRGGFSAKTHKSQSKKHHVVLCAPACPAIALATADVSARDHSS